MLTFQIEHDSKGFHVWCPELPGCHTHGRTRAEALQNLKDALQLYLEDIAETQLLDQTIQKPRTHALV